jgi:hypothetical protein
MSTAAAGLVPLRKEAGRDRNIRYTVFAMKSQLKGRVKPSKSF